VQRAGLFLFATLFLLLFAGVAIGVGLGTGRAVPLGAVALVEGAPDGLRVITKREFAHEMKVQALEQGLKGIPGPGNPEYPLFKREVMSKLIGVDWVEAQAIEMDLAPTPREIVEKLSPGEGKAIKELGLTQKDVDARMRWYLAGDKIQEMLAERVPEPSIAEIKDYYEEDPPPGESLAEARDEISVEIKNQRTSELFNRVETKYRSEWRARTRCAEDFMVEECGNFPSFGHPVTSPLACYEADPEEPAEGCQAPVVANMPSLPGSIRWWRPEGERVAQGPVPAGGVEAEEPAE
jgi:hypothetical protein